MQELSTTDWDFDRIEDGFEEFVKTIKPVKDTYASLRAIRSKCKSGLKLKSKMKHPSVAASPRSLRTDDPLS